MAASRSSSSQSIERQPCMPASIAARISVSLSCVVTIRTFGDLVAAEGDLLEVSFAASGLHRQLPIMMSASLRLSKRGVTTTLVLLFVSMLLAPSIHHDGRLGGAVLQVL